jgi:hypothetical protein
MKRYLAPNFGIAISKVDGTAIDAKLVTMARITGNCRLGAVPQFISYAGNSRLVPPALVPSDNENAYASKWREGYGIRIVGLEGRPSEQQPGSKYNHDTHEC